MAELRREAEDDQRTTGGPVKAAHTSVERPVALGVVTGQPLSGDAVNR